MTPDILGLHHLTATVADAQDDLRFYAALLGLRLVKKTVNFDNHNVFHFYYGDEVGTPSTIMTTFPYKGWGVPVGTKGAGQITETAFSVPPDALPWWLERFAANGVATRSGERFGAGVVAVEDPSGLRIELIGAADDGRAPWAAAGIDSDHAIRGLHSVTLRVRDPAPTLAFLTDVLGYEVAAEEGERTRAGVHGNGPGRTLDIVRDPDAPSAVNGLGTVHHVAMAIGDGQQQEALREELLRLGRKVTEVRDRQYFTSIYFREPGGILYEVATVGPGFTVDESKDRLGTALRLPPWEEPHRADIEKNLPPIRTPS